VETTIKGESWKIEETDCNRINQPVRCQQSTIYAKKRVERPEFLIRKLSRDYHAVVSPLVLADPTGGFGSWS
jgi:hypothetical protein